MNDDYDYADTPPLHPLGVSDMSIDTDTDPTPPQGTERPGYQPPTAKQIRTYLGLQSTSSNHLSISINTTSAEAAGYAGEALVNLIATILAYDEGADIDFESAVTSRTHYDTAPF